MARAILFLVFMTCFLLLVAYDLLLDTFVIKTTTKTTISRPMTGMIHAPPFIQPLVIHPFA